MSGFSNEYKNVLISKSAKIFLKLENLKIEQSGNEAMIALKDISSIILESPAITLTSALLSKCAKYKIVVLTCDEFHNINGLFAPFLGHFKNAGVAKEQINVKQKVNALLWQKIIKNKIKNQAKVLEFYNLDKDYQRLINYSKNVKVNDGSNLEATAAAHYFKALFSKDFYRDKICFENSALNYGYSIIRSCIVREVCISGLLPFLGIKHKNELNQFCLCDDLIEPFRAFVDIKVKSLEVKDEFLSKDDRVELINLLDFVVLINKKNLPISRAITRYVQSFKSALLYGEELLEVEFSDGQVYESFIDV